MTQEGTVATVQQKLHAVATVQRQLEKHIIEALDVLARVNVNATLHHGTFDDGDPTSLRERIKGVYFLIQGPASLVGPVIEQLQKIGNELNQKCKERREPPAAAPPKDPKQP